MVPSMLDITPENNITQYIQNIRKFPLLTAEEEFTYAKQWKEEGNIQAAHKLINAHLRLVVKIATTYKRYALPLNELISEGNIGMLQAIQRFNPDRGFRFTTYAIWWIKAAIQEYILHNWSLVKIGTTAAQKKLFFNLRRVKSQIKAFSDTDLTPEQLETISEKLGVTTSEIQSMNQRLSAQDHSLNTPMGNDSDYNEWQNMLVDDAINQEESYAEREELSQRHNILQKAMEGLKPREREILTERRLKDKPATLEELSKVYKISRERIRQIETRAFEKLQEIIQKAHGSDIGFKNSINQVAIA
ncbi:MULTISPECIES: RNA polymerase sigma factor RpoH [Commensalibacter]|uniref:RNA polymerase sigma factor RpoH n=1 Tax=Commensalibacter TaxID=1079922 RepID=UPI000EFD4648|nr:MULTISPECIES: RNA polymerase sigma factor RpoH [Commensalibacter]MCT6842617.1 RNA polymerase sigma factor RpoH [Commensalibacter sp.]AYN86252.1 RNA polymerase sigma factor RpoH [Commensalibacter melissae]MBH9970442.1 RNA polymerase sigma factor RpoH [Commensalibacter sp. M0265]MBH9973798.1 RNA polymerase sigma factor RpoH [Commensalibacter melissae]MBH9977863.1 RNA polymerase sigma factor RpoH [Commensalibacter sp. M0266]